MTDITLPREIAERGLQALEQMYKRAASVETQEASDQYLQNLADNPMSGEIALEAQEVLFIRGAIDALRERLAQPEQEPVAWQRIETAPKTGRKVILFYLNRNNLPRTVMARWLSDDKAAEIDTDCVGLEGGWYECIDNWDDYTEVAIHEGEPTYWMPLPPAPTAKGKPDAA